jgi:nitrogenase-stabilizing/protective protein
MTTSTLLEELAELESAEDFLNYFNIAFDPTVVQVYRLHILQRFHDYLHTTGPTMPTDKTAQKAVYAGLLQQAYQDFVQSDALTEKVFKVFHRHEPQTVFIPLEQVGKRPGA